MIINYEFYILQTVKIRKFFSRKQSKASHAGYFGGGKKITLYNSDFKLKIKPFLLIFIFLIQTQTLIWP
jgi:hypothetical protein